MQKIIQLFILGLAFTLVACSDDNGEDVAPAAMANFTVTLENISTPLSFFSSGTTGVMMPGDSLQFVFNAGIGQNLSFATMFVQSNDLFYAPGENGIALYDNSGNALTGDITAQLDLWDAGTEVNQEPGVGDEQAPRQSGNDVGTVENGTVQIVNDAFTYPNLTDIIQVNVDHDGGTRFTVTIKNLSNNSSLPTPLAPGVWVVHPASATPLFEVGGTSSLGLEALAEDGVNNVLGDELTQNSGLVTPFSPGAYAVFNGNDNPIFVEGQPASPELEAVAEDGIATGFVTALANNTNVTASGAFDTPISSSAAGPIFPGDSYQFSFVASEGQTLSFATMFIQSNDLFIGGSVQLFQNGQAVSGDFTNQMNLWDAFTEVNEFPGAGNSQAPRQAGPDTGTAETGNVNIVNDGFIYPLTSDVFRISITSTPIN